MSRVVVIQVDAYTVVSKVIPDDATVAPQEGTEAESAPDVPDTVETAVEPAPRKRGRPRKE